MHSRVSEFTLPSASGICEIYCRLWTPEKVRCVVQLAHGMMEHCGRYDAFARFLNANGIAAAANDHLGHGKSIKDKEHFGFIAPSNGWDFMLSDMLALHNAVKHDFPDVPYILMGHSMGSFLARSFASRRLAEVDAYIFSGTAGRNPAIGLVRPIVKMEIKKNGGQKPSPLLMNLAFGSYGNRFKPQRTGFDWLSRDTAAVDLYNEDPLCGFAFTAGGFLDLFEGLMEINRKGWAASVPDVPILLVSGTDDPVGDFSKGVREVNAALKAAGRDVTMKLYEGGRHEMLNETNKDEVYADILGFTEKVIEKRGVEV
ncbi:MAG: Phospholipase YtpA [Firmicutes bacterium ADurb.Bin182]|nr:MAG: Phospholipase YtpA [Firmicutes bacterium ADurb.Bin182]